MKSTALKMAFRQTACPSDRTAVRRIAESTGYFSGAEIAIAVELVDEWLSGGREKSGYHFLFAENGDDVVGFCCFGPVPATLCSFDLYWIIVRDDFQGQGAGRELLSMSESSIQAAGGRRIYVETSARDQYEPTRRFYEAQGYRQAAFLPDFYASGDAKIIYVKVMD
ncbi:MAG: GNAT family N-acetyltransferase [Syntrophales bacterium]|nr:GNAT family N-acetyltransferase [Syntrophales bacterium]